MSGTTSSEKLPTILILGPLPPPLFGPAIATRILLNSNLSRLFSLVHLNTNTHRELITLGKFRFAGFFVNLRLYTRLMLLILRKRPDLVLVPISQTTLGFVKDSVFIWISLLLRRPTVVQLRGSEFKNWFRSSSRVIQRLVVSTLIRTQAVIVLGKRLRYLFAGFYSPERIFVVPNGCNVELPPASPRTDSALRLLYLSNLQPSKGIEDVLWALARIIREVGPDVVTLDVVGPWLENMRRSELTAQCRRENLPVRFHPVADGKEKFEYFVNADVFLFPPREPEGHPWVIVEAMAAGLPIISTDQGAITESVIDGVNGFIVEKQNPQQIADKILYLLENPEIRQRMGRASRELYLQKFTEEKMVERLAACFNAVMSSE